MTTDTLTAADVPPPGVGFTTRIATAPADTREAAGMVARTLRDGAYAAAVLDAELGRAAQLDARDRALATELVYGALRLRGPPELRVEHRRREGAVAWQDQPGSRDARAPARVWLPALRPRPRAGLRRGARGGRAGAACPW